MKITLKRTCISAAITSLLAPHAGFAQHNNIDEIVVTSEKLGRTLIETTTSIELLTGEELEKRSIEDLYDIVVRTPNVGQSFGEKGFNIRGVDQRGAGAGTGLLVNTIVDGASLPNNQSTFFGPYSAWDLEQVEILRGPQGTTQGRNAIGGSIIINSAKPSLQLNEGRARASVGDEGLSQLAFAQNLVAIEDELAFRVSVENRESDGFVFNPTLDQNHDEREALTLRAKALWAPNDKFEALWTTNFTNSNGGVDVIDFLNFPAERNNFSNEPAFEGSEHLVNTLTLSYQLNEAVSIYSSSTAYQHDYLRMVDVDNTALATGALNRVQDDSSFSTELRVNYDVGGRFRGVTGVYYGDFDNTRDDGIAIPVFFILPDSRVLSALGINPNSLIFRDLNGVDSEENLALFGEFEYDINDRLTLIAGARYDDEERVSRTVQVVTSEVPLPLPLPPTEVEPLDSSFDALLPKLGLRYSLSDNTVFGFTAQSAYRAGGQSVSNVSATVANFDTETAWNYEASLRSASSDGRFSVSANLFYTDWTDQQVSRRTDFAIMNDIGADNITINAGESRLYGAEFNWDAQWTENVSSYFAVGLLNTEYQDFVSGEIDNSGNEFAFAPSATVNAGLDYQAENGFVARADVNWRGDQFSDAENMQGTQIDAYALVNLKLGYQSDNWSVFAFARNLFDEEYVTQIQPAERNRSGNIVLQDARTGEPRVIGVEFNYSWGQ